MITHKAERGQQRSAQTRKHKPRLIFTGIAALLVVLTGTMALRTMTFASQQLPVAHQVSYPKSRAGGDLGAEAKEKKQW